jgi:uncharacterized cupin superfamily protein
VIAAQVSCRAENFAVNLMRLGPGGESALLPLLSEQDGFVYVLEGEPTLLTDKDEVTLSPGMCAGERFIRFRATDGKRWCPSRRCP